MRNVRRTLCVAAVALTLSLASRAAARGAAGGPGERDPFDVLLAEASDAYARGDLVKARGLLETSSKVVNGRLSREFWRAVASWEFRKAVDTVSWVLLVWVTLGFLGQGLFCARFVVQWLASERRGESVVPLAFWYLSIGGSLLVLAYAVWRFDPVFMLAYAFNSLIYVRNLMLIHRKRVAAAAVATAASQDAQR